MKYQFIVRFYDEISFKNDSFDKSYSNERHPKDKQKCFRCSLNQF